MAVREIFAMDVCTDNPWSSAFAIAAVKINQYGDEVERFEGREKDLLLESMYWHSPEERDGPTRLDTLMDLTPYEDNRRLHNAFYSFYMSHSLECELVIPGKLLQISKLFCDMGRDCHLSIRSAPKRFRIPLEHASNREMFEYADKRRISIPVNFSHVCPLFGAYAAGLIFRQRKWWAGFPLLTEGSMFQ